MDEELTQELVQSLFDYRNGNLYWKVNRTANKVKGNKAGSLNQNDRYYHIRIDGKNYYTHRLIFLYHYGFLPKEIDHINGDSLNNQIGNLREVTHQQNGMNSKPNKNGSSKYKGVTWFKRDQKWQSQIKINSKNIYLGRFINEIDAAITYNEKAKELFGEYACLNDIDMSYM